jgi:hypothetical protein
MPVTTGFPAFAGNDKEHSFVMAGLVPAIHVFEPLQKTKKTWMPAT